MKTRAIRADGGWILNGTKHFISHGDFADFVLVIARADKDGEDAPTAFLVERGTGAFDVGRIHPKMGWRGYANCAKFAKGRQVRQGKTSRRRRNESPRY